MSAAQETRERPLRRLEPAALAGVMSRDVTLFGRYWKATTFSSVVQPTIYLLAFGLGIGALFSSAFPGMFNTFVRWKFQRTYDAMLAAPVDVEELITAEVLWISLRAGVYGVAPILVAMAFGLEPSWGMLLVPEIGFLTGFGFASFGVAIAAVAQTIDNFNYVTSAVLTPLFLVAGTFFPVSTLPPGVRTVAQFNPLFHCVQLVRDAVFDQLGLVDLYHAGFLLVFALLMWRLAISQLGRRLID
jgi:lipooligosaccharide transport system permease protein